LVFQLWDGSPSKFPSFVFPPQLAHTTAGEKESEAPGRGKAPGRESPRQGKPPAGRGPGAEPLVFQLWERFTQQIRVPFAFPPPKGKLRASGVMETTAPSSTRFRLVTPEQAYRLRSLRRSMSLARDEAAMFSRPTGLLAALVRTPQEKLSAASAVVGEAGKAFEKKLRLLDPDEFTRSSVRKHAP